MLLLTSAAPAQFAYTDEFGDPCKNFAKCAADLMVMVRPCTPGCRCKTALLTQTMLLLCRSLSTELRTKGKALKE